MKKEEVEEQRVDQLHQLQLLPFLAGRNSAISLCGPDSQGSSSVGGIWHNSIALQRGGKSSKLLGLNNQKDHDLYFGHSKLYGYGGFSPPRKEVGPSHNLCVALINSYDRTISRISKPSKRRSHNLLMPVVEVNLLRRGYRPPSLSGVYAGIPMVLWSYSLAIRFNYLLRHYIC
jgi:hypothetical protein